MAASSPLVAAWLNVPVAWLLVGVGLALATIALVSLLRTRWRWVKPWKKCALLSLWVHLLLAYAATVVQIAAGGIGPGSGYGPPIEVALVATEITPLAEVTEVAASEAPLEAEAPPAEAGAGAEELTKLPDDSHEAAPAGDAEPLAAPDLLPQPPPEEPAEPAKPTEPAGAAADDASPTPAPDAVVLDDAQSPPPENSAAAPASPPTNPEPATAAAPTPAGSESPAASGENVAASAGAAAAALTVPDAYADRFAPNRAQLVAGGGGNADTERAVAAALGWLAQAQSDDGRWEVRRYGAGQERYVLGHDRGGAGAKADTGVGGLALLAFLGAGHSHRGGPYAAEVARGLDFLRRTQRTNGNLAGDAELFAQTYCHSMASFAVGEALALTKDERLEPIVRGAAEYSLAIQHPVDGGWRYRPGDTGDTSQLGWQVMSLKSAELGGVAVPPATWTRVARFLQRVERGQAGGLAVYRPEEALPSRPMTAEALYCRQLTTGRPDGGLSPAALGEAISSLSKEPPSNRQVNFYYWYYATLALHRAQHASPAAAEAWRAWNDALARTLLGMQEADGSWPATCVWGGYGGRVYATSLGAMCLEVYYRYAPTDAENAAPLSPEELARRQSWQASPR